MDATTNPVGPERTLHVEKIVDDKHHVVEYRLEIRHRIKFPIDDPKAWCIPDEFVAATLSDGLREFVNSCRCTDVIQEYLPPKNVQHECLCYFDEDGTMHRFDEGEED